MTVVSFRGRKMTDQILASVGVSKDRHVNQWIGIYIAAALSMLVGLAGWSASQFVSIRDSVQSLQDKIPVQLESINSRLTSVEHRMDTQDERLYHIERPNLRN